MCGALGGGARPSTGPPQRVPASVGVAESTAAGSRCRWSRSWWHALDRDAKERVERVGGRNQRYWIEEIDTTGLFEIPSRPTPREQFAARAARTSVEGTWTTVHVEVLDGNRVVASYDRNYSMLDTFEPFRQGERRLALVAPDNTATSVMDLATNEILGRVASST